MGKIILEGFNKLKKAKRIKHREVVPFSFGDENSCKHRIEEIFKEADETINQFVFLPEYERVAKYLSNTKGKGLFLSGSVGRGKSLITENVIPTLFDEKNKMVNLYHANGLGENFKDITSKKFICIDDVGTEGLYKDYGNESEPFKDIVEYAERNNKVLFITTNLGHKEFIDRYGTRIIDRLKQLCYFVKFEGASFRKKVEI